MIYHNQDKHKKEGVPITCHKCHQAGGTLEKIGIGKYRHVLRCPSIVIPIKR